MERHCFQQLPDGYEKTLILDLQKDTKLALVVWGAVFLALNLAMGAKHFWFIYMLQLVNVSGAAGDLYVSFRFLRMPKDILVQDTGVSMTVFKRN